MKMYILALVAVLFGMSMVSASNVQYIDDDFAQEHQLYVRDGAFFRYVGAPVENYLQSGYVPFIPTGVNPCFRKAYASETIAFRS